MYNFRWQIPGKLAGMARPDIVAAEDAEDDTAWLVDNGVGAVISLTEAPLHEAKLTAKGVDVLHLPVPDGSPPTLEQLDEAMAFIDAQNADGKGVAVHCAAGHGRTGTLLACCLIKAGVSSRQAVAKVRHLDPFAIETTEQVMMIAAYEEKLRPGEEG